MKNLINKSPKILVIGDLIVDNYLWGNCNRISPEAPVQIVDIKKENSVLGGAGNVVNNLQILGVKTDILSVVGDCEHTKILKKLLKNIQIPTKYLITQKNRITSKKTRIVASQQQVVRYDNESTDDINKKSQNKILETFKTIIKDYDCILLSDYGKGVLTNNLTKSLIKTANIHNKKVLIDPKGLDYSKYQNAYLLTPNKKEASDATRVEITDSESLAFAIKKLKKECNLDVSLITLSEQGIAIFDDSLRTHPTKAREIFDVTGAGDTVLASLGFAISCGFDIDKAVKFANLAAGVVVGKIGSATASINEISAYESTLNQSSSETHIKTIDEIKSLTEEFKANNKSIIFTNGCFDILHAGHVKYLEKAKSFGDILIVGLNSDDSVKKLKGKDRPINLQDDRAYILASLEAVDFVVIFKQDTPIELIKIITPDILVKGGDYQGKKVVGQEIAHTLKLVQFVDGKSTTKTIEKIKNENNN